MWWVISCGLSYRAGAGPVRVLLAGRERNARARPGDARRVALTSTELAHPLPAPISSHNQSADAGAAQADMPDGTVVADEKMLVTYSSVETGRPSSH
jgi:hypothetical protein